MKRQRRRFQALSDADLLELIHSSGDQLPREALDEILRRGSRIIPLLGSVVADKAAWTQPLPEWWATVHATYALGAMEDRETLIPLLTALRWADAFDCDWVTEDLPSMFGRLGAEAFAPLRVVLDDVTAGGGARSIALASMASVALVADYLRDEVFRRAAAILADEREELYLRQTAANVLLDFRVKEFRDLLVSFGKEESERQSDDPQYRGVLYEWEVDDFMEEGAPTTSDLDYYQRDWLAFYDPEEIERRQERWRREQEEAAQESSVQGAEPSSRDPQRPCSCGSGQPYDRCCYLKIH